MSALVLTTVVSVAKSEATLDTCPSTALSALTTAYSEGYSTCDGLTLSITDTLLEVSSNPVTAPLLPLTDTTSSAEGI